jgi:hypothetical protein
MNGTLWNIFLEIGKSSEHFSASVTHRAGA